MKAKVIKNSLIVLLFALTSDAYAWKECKVFPTHVWLGFDVRNVWVCLESGGCFFNYKDENTSEDQLNALYSSAMAAITANKSLLVRYRNAETEADCDLAKVQNRGDIDGFWYLK